MNMKMKSTIVGVASAMALASGIAAAQTTFSGFTDGCFGVGCIPPSTPTTATQSISVGGLTYANSTFSVTTANGFLSYGGAPGTPNVDNLGSFALNGTPFSYLGTRFNLGIIFTGPATLVPDRNVITSIISGNVVSVDNGGVFVDFDNTRQRYTTGQGATLRQFDFWINDLSVTPGRVVAVSGSIMDVTAIPEPETYAMMLAGLGLMGFIARRRKQNAA